MNDPWEGPTRPGARLFLGVSVLVVALIGGLVAGVFLYCLAKIYFAII